jgi:hypothetical protein
MDLFSPIIVSMVTALLVLLVGYLAKTVKETLVLAGDYLSTKMNVEDYTMFRGIARDIVLTLMQHPAYKDLTGAEKKEMAIVKITNYLDEVGLNFSHEQVSEIIEAVYAEIGQITITIPEATL